MTVGNVEEITFTSTYYHRLGINTNHKGRKSMTQISMYLISVFKESEQKFQMNQLKTSNQSVEN